MSQEETPVRPMHVTVLAGGDSSERDVSLDSGRAVAEALRQRSHVVELFDPAVAPLEGLPKSTEIILPMLHGTGAEDGTLQARLNRMAVPWLGSSAESSKLTFDKIATKELLSSAGHPLAPGVALHAAMKDNVILSASRRIGYPQVIKPAEQGSSVGISIVRAAAEVSAAVREARRWGIRFLIEQYIVGREVTVPVIDDCVFPAVEILPSGEWYDYSAKYQDDSTGYRVAPPDLPAELSAIVRDACRVCGVSAISRTDLRIGSGNRCHILEINTIPGMTSHSLVPMSASSIGISMGVLCEQLLLKRLGRIRCATWERNENSLGAAA